MDSLHPRRSFYMEDQDMKLGPEQNVQMPIEDRDLFDYNGRTRHLRIFPDTRKIKSTLN